MTQEPGVGDRIDPGILTGDREFPPYQIRVHGDTSKHPPSNWVVASLRVVTHVLKDILCIQLRT